MTLTGTTTGGTDVFVIQLNPATATYTVDMIGTVDVTTEVDFSSSGYDFAGGNTAWNGFVPDTEDLDAPVFLDNNSRDLLLTPERLNAPFGTINTTATAGGVGGAGGDAGNNIGIARRSASTSSPTCAGIPAGLPTQSRQIAITFSMVITRPMGQPPYSLPPPAASSDSPHSSTTTTPVVCTTMWSGTARPRRSPESR